MSEEQFVKPPRKEPVLQPMRIVQVDGPSAPTGMPAAATDAQAPTITPTNPTGKKLVMSKKEIEAMKRKPKSNMNVNIKPAAEILTANTARIDDLDRNARVSRADDFIPEYDVEWVEKTGGRLVNIAWLQTPVSVSGFLGGESTLSPQKVRGLTMSWTNEGLFIKIDNTKGLQCLLIPAANVKCMDISG